MSAMKTGLHQHQALKQELRINPRLYQAMDLLYMPLLDLQQHLKQELLSNPFLELLEPEDANEVTAADVVEEKPAEKEKDGDDEPDWEKLRAVPPITLTEEEKAFLDGPTAELCRMVNDWSIRHNEKEIPREVWDFVKKHGFLGMLISKEHGGLGFSPQAQSRSRARFTARVCVSAAAHRTVSTSRWTSPPHAERVARGPAVRRPSRR